MYLSLSEPLGRNRGEPVHLAGLRAEGPPASTLHVASGQHPAPDTRRLLSGAARSREGHKCICTNLLQEYWYVS